MKNATRPADLAAFGRAIRAARQRAGQAAAGMTLDEVAAATGISKPYLSNIETARAPGPPSEKKLRALGKVLGMDVGELLAAADWLRTPASVRKALLGAEAPRRADGAIDLDQLMRGTGEMETRGQGDTETRRPGDGAGGAGDGKQSTYSDMIGVKRVPLINKVAAGRAGEFGDLSYPAGVADAYVAAPDLPEAPAGALFAVRVAGDSMCPEYREGDILIVGPGEARDGDDCVVRTGEAENYATTFKRVFFVKGADGEVTGARLVPLNPAHPERLVQLEEVTGVYPLVYRLVPGRAGRGGGGAGVKASEKLRELRD